MFRRDGSGPLRFGNDYPEEPRARGRRILLKTNLFFPAIAIDPASDISKPPPHTWGHEQFLAMLCAQTDLRAVPDPQSASGWKIDRGPFPGWAKLPEW